MEILTNITSKQKKTKLFYKAELVFFQKLKKYYQASNAILYFKKQVSTLSIGKNKELKWQIVKSLMSFNKFIIKYSLGNIDQIINDVRKMDDLIANEFYFKENVTKKIEQLKSAYQKVLSSQNYQMTSKRALTKKLMKLKTHQFVKNQYNQKSNFYEATQGYFFISPAIILISIFMLFSIGFGIYMSFHKVKATGFGLVYTFVGFKQYEYLFQSKSFAYSLRITLIYMLIVAPTQTLLSLIISSILASKIKGRKIFIVLYFLPTLTSATALTLIFLRLFGTGGPIGTYLGNNFVNKNILLLVAIMNIWTSIPYFMTIYNAAHTDIPKSQYEAAAIDGASSFKQFFKITVPYLKMVTAFVLLTSIIWTLQTFDQLYIIGRDPTLAIPSKEITSTATWIYNVAFGSFRHQDFGRAAAGSIVLAAIIFVFSFLSNWLSKGRR